jgi:hypothetical protein
MINRAVLIARPKQPFLDWAASLDDSGVLPDASGEQNAYLIPLFEEDSDVPPILEQVHRSIFENELWSWDTDESHWPKVRDLETFQKWFALEVHSVVEDLCGYELLDDRGDEDADGDEDELEDEDEDADEDEDYDDDDEDEDDDDEDDEDEGDDDDEGKGKHAH